MSDGMQYNDKEIIAADMPRNKQEKYKRMSDEYSYAYKGCLEKAKIKMLPNTQKKENELR